MYYFVLNKNYKNFINKDADIFLFDYMNLFFFFFFLKE